MNYSFSLENEENTPCLPGEVLESLSSLSSAARDAALQLKKSLPVDQVTLEQPDPRTKTLTRHPVNVPQNLRGTTPAGTRHPLARKAEDSNRLNGFQHKRETTPAGTRHSLARIRAEDSNRQEHKREITPAWTRRPLARKMAEISNRRNVFQHKREITPAWTSGRFIFG